MGLETKSIQAINTAFIEQDLTAPSMHWEHGTLWVDTNSEEDMNLVADTLENNVLSSDYTTSMNCLKATETEPWDQWAVDIVQA